MAVTCVYVVMVLCVYVLVWITVLTEEDARQMHDEENPIPSLMDDENGDSA